MSHLLFLFLDGVGFGQAGDRNPFFLARSRFLPFYHGGELPDGTPVKPIDATLGVSGTPQSATGQTTLFTGINAAALLRAHRGSFPDRRMRRILFETNLLKSFRAFSTRSYFLNAYPYHTRFFSSGHLRLKPDGRLVFSREFPPGLKRSISVSSCMLLSCRLTPFGETELTEKRALYQDYTNRLLIRKGARLPRFTPRDAADILARAAGENQFTLYEYFLTDLFAHRESPESQVALIKNLDRMMGHLFSRLNPLDTTLIVTSDHGNLEDNRSRRHTLNPVPLLAWGEKAPAIRSRVQSIADLARVILDEYRPIHPQKEEPHEKL